MAYIFWGVLCSCLSGSYIILVFFCCLLPDMIQERNSLMELVYPKLKKVCREKFQLQFQVKMFLFWFY